MKDKDKRFKNYKFKKGQIVIVTGPILIDGVPFPFLASVSKAPDKYGDNMQVISANGASWYCVLPFYHPTAKPKANDSRSWIATPLDYPYASSLT